MEFRNIIRICKRDLKKKTDRYKENIEWDIE